MIYCISSVFYVRHQDCSLLKTRCLTNVGNEVKSQSFLILILSSLFLVSFDFMPCIYKNNLCVPSVLKTVFQMPDYFSSHIHIYSFPIAFVQGKGKGLRLVFFICIFGDISISSPHCPHCHSSHKLHLLIASIWAVLCCFANCILN